jgi:fructose-bisphosphate aldolase class 1
MAVKPLSRIENIADKISKIKDEGFDEIVIILKESEFHEDELVKFIMDIGDVIGEDIEGNILNEEGMEKMADSSVAILDYLIEKLHPEKN